MCNVAFVETVVKQSLSVINTVTENGIGGSFKMSDQDWLQLELQNDGVMLVTMQNAPVNAFNPKSLGELETLFVKLASDDATKAVVLASDLKQFSAGLDRR